jgi:hypothetical protein
VKASRILGFSPDILSDGNLITVWSGPENIGPEASLPDRARAANLYLAPTQCIACGVGLGFGNQSRRRSCT